MNTELKLPRRVESVRRARRTTVEWLAGRTQSEAAETLPLIVDELVTNVVVNGTEPITLRLEQRSNLVHVEVDDGEGEPLHDSPPAADLGLRIVQRLAYRCGTRRTEDGAAKWAEVALT
jgi:two-component sensor histidine kinase